MPAYIGISSLELIIGTGYLLERLSTVQLFFVDLPNREATYYNKADEFEAHSARLAETG